MLRSYDANNPQSSTGNQQNSGGTLFGGNSGPGEITGGAGYAFGVGVSRVISQRLQVTVGLHYTAYRFRTSVGTYKPMDTALSFRSQTVAIGGYYRNGSQEDYAIRYQVLEIPVSLAYKLSPTVPLFFSVSALYGRLLKSNALTFDRTANIYYQNKENLQRNFFSLSSSLQYSIIRRQTFTINAGPVVQYQLTGLQKEDDQKPRLFFAGIKTSVQF
jgi:hypothetical protein